MLFVSHMLAVCWTVHFALRRARSCQRHEVLTCCVHDMQILDKEVADYYAGTPLAPMMSPQVTLPCIVTPLALFQCNITEML